MPTVYYHKIPLDSGTEELFTSFSFEFCEDRSEVHAIATYASKEEELRADIEDFVKYCSKSFLHTKKEKDFFKEWEYKFIDLETEKYLQFLDEQEALVI